MNIIEKLNTLESVYCILTGETLFVKDLRITKCILIETPFDQLTLSNEGKIFKNGECLLFPSKENRNWNSVNVCKYKDGEPVMVSHSKDNYYLRYHTGRKEGELHMCYTNQKKSGEISGWLNCFSIEDFLKL